jgi:hypothetical protein
LDARHAAKAPRFKPDQLALGDDDNVYSRHIIFA